MKRVTLIPVIVAVCCFSALKPATAQDSLLFQTNKSHFWNTFIGKFYLHTFDRAAASLGLMPLRKEYFPKQKEEIRVWVVIGNAIPNHLYRIVKNNDIISRIITTGRTFTGSSIFWWRTDYIQPKGQTATDIMIYTYKGMCHNFRVNDGIGTCKATFTKIPDWQKIFYLAKQYSIWNLPDQSTFKKKNKNAAVLGASSFIVEIRKGNRYRSYHYTFPHPHFVGAKAAKAEKKATKIDSLFESIDSHLKRRDVEKYYRGITSGNYRSAFKLCGSDRVWGLDLSLKQYAKVTDSTKGTKNINIPAPGPFGYIIKALGMPSPKWVTAKRKYYPYNREFYIRKLISIKPAMKAKCK
jgi:hypothetical protein